MALRPATPAEIAALSLEALNDDAIGSVEALVAYAAAASWKVQVSPEGMTLREGSRDSIAAVLAVDHACFEPLWAYDRRLLAGYLEADRFVEACATDGELVGFTLTGVEAGQGSLGRLAVAPALRRQGLGTILVEDAIRALAWQGVGYVTLTTQVENAAARALYASCGFYELPGTLVALTIEA